MMTPDRIDDMLAFANDLAVFNDDAAKRTASIRFHARFRKLDRPRHEFFVVVRHLSKAFLF